MSKVRAGIVSLLALAPLLVAAACAPAQPPVRNVPPDEAGPWEVGLTTTTMVDPARDDRSLAVDVWYPVDAGDAAGVDEAELDLLFTTLGLDGVLADAEPSSAGSFPLVVFSHGNGGVRYQSYFLLRALASHGFVVAAPDHTGNTAIDSIFGTSDPGSVAARNRPRDVSFVIDEMLAQNGDRSDPLAPVVDPDRIAVGGHSFGGFTALATAGGFGDYAPDPRVKAIVPLAAASGGLSDDELASIDVPTMLIGGTSDVTVPIEDSTERVWSLLRARQSYRVDIARAGHNSFTNVCDLADAFEAGGAPPPVLDFLASAVEEACAPGLIDIDEAHRIITTYTVAFLKKTVTGRGSYTRYLTPSYPRWADLPIDYVRSLGRAPARA